MLKYILMFAACAAVICYEIFERNSIVCTKYLIRSNKLIHSVRCVVIADLHGFRGGKANSYLAAKIEEQKPDLILIPGDLISKTRPETYDIALDLCRRLAAVSPVYMSMGNHDKALYDRHSTESETFFGELKNSGVHLLDNESDLINQIHSPICLYGLTLDKETYSRTGSREPVRNDLLEKLGNTDRDMFSILLAHTPAGIEAYTSWGADLTVSGHYHGGVLRIGSTGLITPQLKIFAPYAHGHFRENNRDVIVTSGLGVHAIPFRIFNRPEIVIADILPEQE